MAIPDQTQDRVIMPNSDIVTGSVIREFTPLGDRSMCLLWGVNMLYLAVLLHVDSAVSIILKFLATSPWKNIGS